VLILLNTGTDSEQTGSWEVGWWTSESVHPVGPVIHEPPATISWPERVHQSPIQERQHWALARVCTL